MASIRKAVASALQKEFVEGTVFRVDLDRVDVAPDGSTGIIRSLPLTGDRDKVQPGDPVRVVTVAGERLALVGDIAFSDALAEEEADASEIVLAENLARERGVEEGVKGNFVDASGISDPVDGQALVWDATLGKFVNETVTTQAAPHTHLGGDITTAVANATLAANSLQLYGSPHTDYGYASRHSVTAAAITAGTWYRVAASPVSIAKFSGLISVEWTLQAGAYHGRVLAYVSCMWGSAPPVLNILGAGTYNQTADVFTKMRVVFNSTYSGNYAYVELYNPSRATPLDVTIRITEPLNMTATWATGGVPGGYLTTEANIPYGGQTVHLGNGIDHPNIGNSIYVKTNQPKFMMAGGQMYAMTANDMIGPMQMYAGNFLTLGHTLVVPGGAYKLIDRSGAGQHYDVYNTQGNVSYGSTYFTGGATGFNGTNSYAENTNGPQMAGGNWQGGGMWVYINAINRMHGLVNHGNTTCCYGLWINTDNKVRIDFFRLDNGAVIQVPSTNTVGTGWNFIGWRFYSNAGAGQINIFLNGTWTNYTSVPVAARNPVGSTRLGQYGSAWLNGLIGPTVLHGWQDIVAIERMYHGQKVFFGY